MHSQSSDCYLARDDNLRNDLFVLTALKVRAGMNVVFVSTASRSDYLVQEIRISALIGIGNDLATTAAILAGINYAPFDHRGIKRHFKFGKQLFGTKAGNLCCRGRIAMADR